MSCRFQSQRIRPCKRPNRSPGGDINNLDHFPQDSALIIARCEDPELQAAVLALYSASWTQEQIPKR